MAGLPAAAPEFTQQYLRGDTGEGLPRECVSRCGWVRLAQELGLSGRQATRGPPSHWVWPCQGLRGEFMRRLTGWSGPILRLIILCGPWMM